MTRSVDEARDAVQDTFLRAARCSPSWGMPHEEAWLVRVLINICRDGWRKHAMQPGGRLPPPPVDRHGAESSWSRARRSGGRSIAARRAAARSLVLYEIEGAAIPAIASCSGSRAVTVRWHLPWPASWPG